MLQIADMLSVRHCSGCLSTITQETNLNQLVKVMKVLFDISPIFGGSYYRGIGAYIRSLLASVLQNSNEDIHFLISKDYDEGRIEEFTQWLMGRGVAKDRIHFWTPFVTGYRGFSHENVYKVRVLELYREAVIQAIQPDVVVLSAFFDDSLLSVKKLSQSIPVAAINYDLIPLMESTKFLKDINFAKWYFDRLDSLLQLDSIYSISEYSNQQLRKYISVDVDKLKVIGTGRTIAKAAKSSSIKLANLTKKYILFVGSPEDPRKNLDGLLMAIKELPETLRNEYQIVIAGKIDNKFKVAFKSKIAALGLLEDQFVLTGFVSDEELELLYASSSLLVHPAFSEGFGLPVAQAMAYGIPFACSNTSSLPEVAGRTDVLFSPEDPISIANVIRKILTSEALVQDLKRYGKERIKTFDWDLVSCRLIENVRKLNEIKHGEKIGFELRPFLDKIRPLVDLLEDNDKVSLANCLSIDFPNYKL